jgi:hypothetical protein
MENNEKNFMLSIHSKVACEDFWWKIYINLTILL